MSVGRPEGMNVGTPGMKLFESSEPQRVDLNLLRPRISRFIFYLQITTR